MVFRLPRDQARSGNLELLLLGVAFQLDYLKTIQKRCWNQIPHVPRRNKENPRQVEGHLNILVHEHVILRRVEHLQQRRRRVAPLALGVTQFVDLVEHKHRVPRLDVPELPYDPPRLCAGPRAVVPPKVRLVGHSAARDPRELQTKRIRNRLGQRRLAHPGRADEAENRSLRVRLLFSHRQEIENPLLRLLESDVVLVQRRLRPRHVDGDFVAPRAC